METKFTLENLKGKHVGVLGLGVEGLSSIKFLHKHAADVVALDKLPESELSEDVKAVLEKYHVRYVGGEDYLTHLTDLQVIVRSPGIKVLHEEIQQAILKGVQVTSQTRLFMDLTPSPVIGVTGTKGKGTTSSLILEMLKADGREAFLGGNIGKPPLDFLDELDIHSWVVLELSSFQLQDFHKSPHIAVMLMVTSEHLDYHEDTYEYVEAKRSILRHQKQTDFAVINRDYPASHESDIHTEGKVYQVSTEMGVPEGCFIKENAVWVTRNDRTTKIIDTNEILLPGKHNLENVCAAVMAATLSGVPKEHIATVLRTFKGLEHRLELVGEVNGVKYYDDSFSTTPETAIAAIKAFSNPEILILGGSHKGSDFTELGKVIAEASNIKTIIGIGLEWTLIEDAIEEAGGKLVIIEGAKDMETIVKAAAKVATEGDVVLLSPACASFDMFKNYKERGNLFKEEVNKLSSKSQATNSN